MTGVGFYPSLNPKLNLSMMCSNLSAEGSAAAQRRFLAKPSQAKPSQAKLSQVGVRIRGTLGDIDPLNKVPFKRATSRVQKGPL